MRLLYRCLDLQGRPPNVLDTNHCRAGRAKAELLVGVELKQDNTQRQTALCTGGRVTRVHYPSGGFSLFCLYRKVAGLVCFPRGLLLRLGFADIRYLSSGSLVHWLCLDNPPPLPPPPPKKKTTTTNNNKKTTNKQQQPNNNPKQKQIRVKAFFTYL